MMVMRWTWGRGLGSTWLLVAILSLLVVVAMAAAVGSAAWIACSGDAAREREDRSMLEMAFAEHRFALAETVWRAARSIADLGPTVAVPVAQRIEAILKSETSGQMRRRVAYLLRDGSSIIAAYPPAKLARGETIDPAISRLIPVVRAANASLPLPSRPAPTEEAVASAAPKATIAGGVSGTGMSTCSSP